MGKQQTVQAGAPRDNAKTWGKINWNHARREVRRLQIRIAKAVLEGRQNKVKGGHLGSGMQHCNFRGRHLDNWGKIEGEDLERGQIYTKIAQR